MTHGSIPSRAEILERVMRLVADHSPVNFHEIHGDHRLIEDLNCDSLDLVELVMDVEDAYGIAIADDTWERLTTVNLIVDHIQKTLSRTPGGGHS